VTKKGVGLTEGKVVKLKKGRSPLNTPFQVGSRAAADNSSLGTIEYHNEVKTN
jgi:hypothetical protein